MAKPRAVVDVEDLLDQLVEGWTAWPSEVPTAAKFEYRPVGRRLLALPKEQQAEVVARLVDRLRKLEQSPQFLQAQRPEASRHACYGYVLSLLLKRKLPVDAATATALVEMVAGLPQNRMSFYWYPLSGVASAVEGLAENGPLDEALTSAIGRAVAELRRNPRNVDARKTADRLAATTADGPQAQINPGEAWSDAALPELAAMTPDERARWHNLLAYCQASGPKVSAKWLEDARQRIEAIGVDDFRERVLRWMPLVDRPRTVPIPRQSQYDVDWDPLIQPLHLDLLRGLAWCAGLLADRAVARALSALALSAYRKVPGRGPRHVALGHAAITALGMMPGMDALGQLAMLKVKVKFIPAQKMIETALTAAAEREKLPREEIDEIAVPAYGMEEVGRRREVLGEYAAELVIDGADAELRWSKAADGKPLKSAPAAVKKDHADDVKDLQAAVKDAARMLSAQRERIDGLFVARKAWPLNDWRERYLDHPLVGTIARRLIWQFASGDRAASGIWLEGRLLAADDNALHELGEGTTVALWHPIGRPLDEVMAWRDWLERHEVRQPFKQAHREVYVLTDAERSTRVYSNRFAAHILRQHQYHALATGRGWKDRLRMMVDGAYPATSKNLPEWGLRAEFWVDGIGNDYRHDTTESGAYLHLATDQVRFYEIGTAQRFTQAGEMVYTPGRREDARPVPLDQVPPLVLSEVLRDVDLFVGVASVGNDPTWADGGPEGRHFEYWSQFSFGNLNATAETRKAVLQRLVPRLKIAPRCTFTDRFLVVRGDLRTYKIHLGSGNILMEPNDQYLCIVPKRSAADPAGMGGVFLPFEGDNVLSIILSKALLLADDRSIKDSTIVSQIAR